jgi:hypothetical protein
MGIISANLTIIQTPFPDKSSKLTSVTKRNTKISIQKPQYLQNKK